MIFGGLQKNSLIDYPGRLCCVLFTAGCNFDCPYCHNPELARGCVMDPDLLMERHVYDFLKLRRGFLEGVVISGGEPTLQKDLSATCRNIQRMGYPVKLDTNGSRPKILQGLIEEGCVDYIAMDIKTDPFAYSPLVARDCKPESILTSIHLVMESNIPYEFRTTCVKPLVNREIVERISTLIQGARLYALQQFHPEKVLHPEFFADGAPRTSAEELKAYQAIAAQRVRSCIIR